MNTVAWCIQHPKGVRWLWAMCDTSVLCVTDDPAEKGKVFQWAHTTERAAKERCIDRIENAEEHGAYLSLEPIFFDLPRSATSEISSLAEGWWMKSPNLYQNLVVLLPS